MHIKQILVALITYYKVTRRAGHTTLMKRGTSNYEQKKLVLLHHIEQGKDLHIKKDEIITINSLDRLRGHNLPLAIDNEVLLILLNDTLHYIEELESEKEQYIKQYRIELLSKEKCREEINYMKAHPFKTLFKTLWQR